MTSCGTCSDVERSCDEARLSGTARLQDAVARHPAQNVTANTENMRLIINYSFVRAQKFIDNVKNTICNFQFVIGLKETHTCIDINLQG